MPHLSHDGTDVVNALGERLAAPGHGDGTLGGVGQHLASHLHTRDHRAHFSLVNYLT